MEEQVSCGTDKYAQRQGEQQAFVALNLDPEYCEMAENCARHYAHRDERPEPCESWSQNQDRSNQFDYARPNPSPRFRSHLCEDVDGLWSGGELEEQGLQQNNSRRDP